MIYPFGQYKYRQTTPTFMLPLCNLLLFSVTTRMNGDKSVYLCNMKLQMRLILIFVTDIHAATCSRAGILVVEQL